MPERVQRSQDKKYFTGNVLNFNTTLRILSARAMECNVIMMAHWSKKLFMNVFSSGPLHYNINSIAFFQRISSFSNSSFWLGNFKLIANLYLDRCLDKNHFLLNLWQLSLNNITSKHLNMVIKKYQAIKSISGIIWNINNQNILPKWKTYIQITLLMIAYIV